MSNKTKGIVMFWNKYHGYGFIEYVTGDTIHKIYVHHTKLVGCQKLKKYQYVKFNIGENEKGKIAENVEVIDFAKIKTNTGAASNQTI